MIPMIDFACGMIAMGYLVAAVFFLKFWVRTQDFLFAVFALAFGLLAIHETLLSWLKIEEETTSMVFLLRFLAFVLIALGIIVKNVGARQAQTGGGGTSVSAKRPHAAHAETAKE